MLSVERSRARLIVFFFAHGLLTASWTAHIAEVEHELHLSDAALGLMLLGGPVGSVTGTVLAGTIVQRIGALKTARVAFLGACAAMIALGLVSVVAGFALVLLVLGGTLGLADVAMNAQAIYVQNEAGRSILAGLHGAWSLGALCGAGVGMLAVATTTSLFAQALPVSMLTAAACIWTTTTEMPGEIPRRIKPAYRLSRKVLLLGGLAWASMLCEGATADWAPVLLDDSLGARRAIVGAGYTAMILGEVLTRLVADRLLGRFGPRPVVALLSLVGAVSLGAGLAIAVPGAVIAGFFGFGVGLATIVPQAFSSAAATQPAAPAAAVATTATLGWTGFVCGPPVIGYLASQYSLPIALLLLPTLCLAIAVVTAVTTVLTQD
jgi:MFS family permease